MINVLKKELKEVFRDKKSLSMMLIIPFFIPLVVIGISALFDSQQNKDINTYNKIGFNYDLSEIEKSIADELQIEVTSKNSEDLEFEYSQGNIDLYVIKENQTYTITGNSNTTTSYALSLMNNYFEIYKQYLQKDYLNKNNIVAEDVINIITIEKDIKEIENFTSDYIINYAFLFILMAITISATYPATDTTAGEKERGTLETLLTFPIKSKDIIIGKFLSVSLSSIITGILSLILTIISLIIANNIFTIYESINLMLSFKQIIFSIIVIIAYSFMISGLCIAIASKCKTFKEAQSALTPLTFISFFPGMVAFMIEIKSTYLLSIIPFINYSLLFNDITKSNIDLISITLMLLSTIIITFIVLFIIIKQYKSEKILFAN